MTEYVALEDAVPGRRYRVTWNDCCAQGSFEAELATVNRCDDGQGGQCFESLAFANGVTVEGLGVGLEEVPVPASPREVDWRAAFAKYSRIVGDAEGVSFLYPSDWPADDWPEIVRVAEESGAGVHLSG